MLCCWHALCMTCGAGGAAACVALRSVVLLLLHAPSDLRCADTEHVTLLPCGLQAWVYLCEELQEVVVAFRGTEQASMCLAGAAGYLQQWSCGTCAAHVHECSQLSHRLCQPSCALRSCS
jgi:hypothetical protein